MDISRAGYATAKLEHKMKDSCWGPYHEFIQRNGEQPDNYDYSSFDIFNGLEGDVRVNNDTIVVTYYNADKVKLLKENYENLPRKLEEEGVYPGVPWLYNYKIDFRFK